MLNQIAEHCFELVDAGADILHLVIFYFVDMVIDDIASFDKLFVHTAADVLERTHLLTRLEYFTKSRHEHLEFSDLVVGNLVPKTLVD